MNKTLVLYATYNNQETNFKKFIHDGIFEDDNVKFIIIFNGKCHDHIRKLIPPYVLFVERENTGYNFGAWSYAILNDHIIRFDDTDHLKYMNLCEINVK